MEQNSNYIYNIYTKCKIYSLDSKWRIYSTMVVKEGRIWAIGMEEILDTLSEEYRIFDLDYKYVFPGLIEGHGHFISLGEEIGRASCRERAEMGVCAAAVEETVEREIRET